MIVDKSINSQSISLGDKFMKIKYYFGAGWGSNKYL